MEFQGFPQKGPVLPRCWGIAGLWLLPKVLPKIAFGDHSTAPPLMVSVNVGNYLAFEPLSYE